MEEVKEYLKNQLNKSLESIKGERWRDIVGYEGFYKVSNFARIKRLSIVFSHRNRWKMATYRRKARIHNYHINDRNMPRVQLSRNGVNKIFSLSRIVATAFIPNPQNLPQVCHKDDDPVNNYYKNLFWGTQQDNMTDKVKKGRQARGEKSGRVRLKEKEVIEIRSKYSGGSRPFEFRKLAEQYNTTRQNIFHIISRRNWKHIP